MEKLELYVNDRVSRSTIEISNENKKLRQTLKKVNDKLSQLNTHINILSSTLSEPPPGLKEAQHILEQVSKAFQAD